MISSSHSGGLIIRDYYLQSKQDTYGRLTGLIRDHLGHPHKMFRFPSPGRPNLFKN